MSGDDDTNKPAGRQQKAWTRPSNTIGRIGGWGSSSGPSSSRPGSAGPRVATLRDVGGGGAAPSMGGHAGHAHGAGGSDDEDDEDENQGPEGESWFAGGERSGISVQNPDRPGAVPGGDLVRDLLRRAAEAGPPPGATSGPVRSSAFLGGGHTLGSEDTDSVFIPDPNAPDEPEEETAIRHLTFWRDGFTVEDGDLMRYDNPEHSRILAEINSGRAPPHILNVSPGQPVELRVVKRLQDDYVPSPKARAAAFTGSGHRLGSPVPATTVSGTAAAAMPGTFPGGSASAPAPAPVHVPVPAPAAERSAESISTRFEVDQTLPTTSVQIRLADGTRMVCRMNMTHTVRDIRNFINASRPENNARAYTIGTTFPNRTLEDDAQTIQAAGLVNSVVVQRWV